ncbi:hypothetical protein Tcan_03408 [Toxocara canis]|nr:hypothetical protein Tcan_03408 [Toxocara canis]
MLIGALAYINYCYIHYLTIGSVAAVTLVSSFTLLQCAKKKKVEELVTPSMRTIAKPLDPSADAAATAPDSGADTAQKKNCGGEKKEKEEEGHEARSDLTPEQLKIAEGTPNK